MNAQATYPLYNTHTDTSPAKRVSLTALVAMVMNPTTSPKDKAACLTPFDADGKTKAHAVQAPYWALVFDHDDDDSDRQQITEAYDAHGCAWLAFTTSSHQQDKRGIVANRWKVVLPLAAPIKAERYAMICNGLALLNKTDRAQARATQVFYAPNMLATGAPYDHINRTDLPLLDASNDADPVISAALEAQEQAQKAAEDKARQSMPKPRNVGAQDGRIIDKAVAAYDLASVIEAKGYTRIGRAYLSPQSTTGNAGVHILRTPNGKERLYSHHGETDPLSSLNHGGHALDVFDVLVALEYGGDFSRALAALANDLDPDGQKERQRQHMKAKDTQASAGDLKALFDDAPQQPEADTVDLQNPPGLAGDICRYIDLNARRPRPELYPFAALHLMALIGRKRSSVYTQKLNMMTLAIAPTAAGKEAAQDAIKRLALAVYGSKYIHGNAGSFKDLIYNQLEGDGASLYVVDEVHSFLGSMKDKNAATYERKMEAEILTMNTTQLYTFRGSEKRNLMGVYKQDLAGLEKALEKSGDDSDRTEMLNRKAQQLRSRLEWLENGLPNPFFSLMGHSVPERLDSFIGMDNIDSGFLGRTLIMRGPETRAKLRRTMADRGEIAALEMSITEALQRIQKSGIIIKADPDAAEYLESAVDWYDDDEQRNHSMLGGIYARAPEHLYRLVSVLGLGRESITLEHAKYAHAMVRQSIQDVKHILLKAYAESDNAAEKEVKQHAWEVIHRNAKGSGETLSRLRQLVEKPKGWQAMQRKDVTRDHFTELVEWMLDRGELGKATTGRSERYVSRAVL